MTYIEHEHELKQLNSKWELTFHDTEEKYYSLENVRKELEQENASLKENLAHIKMDH